MRRLNKWWDLNCLQFEPKESPSNFWNVFNFRLVAPINLNIGISTHLGGPRSSHDIYFNSGLESDLGRFFQTLQCSAETPTRRAFAHGHVICRRCQSRIHSWHFRSPRIKEKDVYTDKYIFFFYSPLFSFIRGATSTNSSFFFFSTVFVCLERVREWTLTPHAELNESAEIEWMNERRCSALFPIFARLLQVEEVGDGWRTIQTENKKNNKKNIFLFNGKKEKPTALHLIFMALRLKCWYDSNALNNAPLNIIFMYFISWMLKLIMDGRFDWNFCRFRP